MGNIIRNGLSVIIGFIIGALVNMLVLQLGMALIPPPSGFDMNSSQGLSEALKVMEFKHCISPFLAHALGTFVGAMVAVKIAVNHHAVFAYVVGSFFFAGGFYMVLILNAPMWFNVSDLILAYFPMAWLALKLNTSRQRGQN